MFHGDRFPLIVQGHRITDISLAIRHPAAVEADEFGVPGQLLDFLEHLLARQEAEMSRVIPFASIFLHYRLLL
jgi:hypothetical protein